MHFQRQLCAALVLAALGVASPIEPLDNKATFTVPQTVARRFLKSGPAAVASVYRKYGKAAPADINAAASNNIGTISATPDTYDLQYLSPVTIGGQTLDLDLDTDSSDL